MWSYSRSCRVVAGLALLAVLGCDPSSAEKSDAKTPPAPLTARVLPVELVPWPTLVRVQGSLQADEIATLSSRVAGLVDHVKVDRGAVVKQGDVLIELRRVDFDLKVAQAEAALKQTRARLGLRDGQKDESLDPTSAPPVREAHAQLQESLGKYERARGLRGTRAIPEEEVYTIKAAVEVNQARYQTAMNLVREMIATLAQNRVELAQAEQARSDSVVRAPFDGIVEHRPTPPGTYVLPGTPLVVLVRTDPLRFTAGVPERRTPLIHPGQKVLIYLEGRPKPLEGPVTRLSPALAMTSRSLTVEVDVPNAGSTIPANYFAEADILVDPEARTMAIPLTALNEFAGVEKVWLVRDGQAIEQRVRTGRRTTERVEILEGLRPGDQVLAEARLGRAGPVQQDRQTEQQADKETTRAVAG